MERFAAWILRYRAFVLGLIVVSTLFFGYQIRNVKVLTDFGDLLPKTHQYIKVHDEFKALFGGANLLVMLIEVKEGDIFNPKTLGKIKYISEQLFRIKGIDRYKTLSIAESKMKDFKYTSWGFQNTYLMYPNIPQTEKEMNELKDAIWSNASYYGGLVSFDNKKSLILADFLEEKLDYSLIYNELNKIRSAVEDDNHILSIVGNPMHLGTVGTMVNKVNFILICTALLIPLLLYLSYRSLWATIIVPSAGIISAIWGIGFMGLMGYNLDPLVIVLPFLISLMAFRHSHQLYNRFYEEYIRHQDKHQCARTVLQEMFLPGLVSVVTDAFGIAIIAIIPIPVLQNIAIACAFWSIITVIIGLILTPVLLTYTPLSLRFIQHVEQERMKDDARRGFANRFADFLGQWLITRRGINTIIAVVLIMSVFCYYWSTKLIVGDAEVGSNLLYPSSRYNQDSARINQTHPLINPLSIIVYGKAHAAIKSTRVLEDIYQFSKYMAKNSGGVGVQNIVQPLFSVAQAMHGYDPKWYGFPDKPNETLQLFSFLTTSGNPGDMDRFIDYHDQFTNIIIFFKDKTGPTIEKALSTAKEYIAKSSLLGKEADYKLAGGVIGVEAAVNEVVAQKQLQTLLFALLGVFFFCTVEFRSVKAGLILTIPLVFSNWFSFAYMALNQIGLSISTLPVSAAGIGMGVDYGIYLLARIHEEKKKEPSISLETALKRTMQTYSKSIIYIAGTLVLGLLVWVLSPLKFQAQMGLMLAVILFFNCLGAIFLVPVLVIIFKPKFLTRGGDE